MNTDKFMTPDDYFLPSDDLLPCEPTGDVPSLPVVTPLGTPITQMSFEQCVSLFCDTSRYFHKLSDGWHEISRADYRVLMDFLPVVGGSAVLVRID
jgi:hypothetical protein